MMKLSDFTEPVIPDDLAEYILNTAPPFNYPDGYDCPFNGSPLFGDMAISGDGNKAVMGLAYKGLGSFTHHGEVNTYFKVNDLWTNGSVLTALVPNDDDSFGCKVTISDDGKWLAVGDNRTRIFGIPCAGCVYIFKWTDNAWVYDDVIVPDVVKADALFGSILSFSADGSRIAVVAYGTRVTYVFARKGKTWVQEAALGGNRKPKLPHGEGVIISKDGTKLVDSPDMNSMRFYKLVDGQWVLEEPTKK